MSDGLQPPTGSGSDKDPSVPRIINDFEQKLFEVFAFANHAHEMYQLCELEFPSSERFPGDDTTRFFISSRIVLSDTSGIGLMSGEDLRDIYYPTSLPGIDGDVRLTALLGPMQALDVELSSNLKPAIFDANPSVISPLMGRLIGVDDGNSQWLRAFLGFFESADPDHVSEYVSNPLILSGYFESLIETVQKEAYYQQEDLQTGIIELTDESTFQLFISKQLQNINSVEQQPVPKETKLRLWDANTCTSLEYAREDETFSLIMDSDQNPGSVTFFTQDSEIGFINAELNRYLWPLFVDAAKRIEADPSLSRPSKLHF